MSEDFDREAEKERLREKYENEEETRQTTEHMSELLLQGATMTNRHCDDCGDPIFRYDGQEFCPTCQQPAEEAADSTDEQATAGDEATGDQDRGERTVEAAGGAGDVRQGQSDDRLQRRAPQSEAQAGTESAGRPTAASGAGGRQSADGTVPRGDLGTARASLVRTLSSLAAEAENATDVRRTRDLLSAAREAAEAIAALDRADR